MKYKNTIVILILLIVVLVSILGWKIIKQKGNANEEQNNESSNIVLPWLSNEKVEELENEAEEMVKQAFNGQFTPYEGENTGSQTISLFSAINSSNAFHPEHQVSTNISNIKDINRNFNYEVSFSYDSEGYINNINIIKKN